MRRVRHLSLVQDQVGWNGVILPSLFYSSIVFHEKLSHVHQFPSHSLFSSDWPGPRLYGAT
jgi:hypothetical protein